MNNSRREYYLSHREEILKSRHDRYLLNKKREREINHEYQESLKLEVLGHYSGGFPKCAKCGIEDIRVLSIDHINGDGCKHRRELGMGAGFPFYCWLKKNNYPLGFQVLCFNCQAIKRFEGKESGGRKEKEAEEWLVA